MSQSRQVDLNALWRYVTDRVKAQVTLPGLWRAMEAARPITIEADELVLGYGVSESHQRGLLMDNQHRNLIEQILESATHHRLRVRLIEGETAADWEAAKRLQAEAARL